MRQGLEHPVRIGPGPNTDPGGKQKVFPLEPADQVELDLVHLAQPGKAQTLPRGLEPLPLKMQVGTVAAAHGDDVLPPRPGDGQNVGAARIIHVDDRRAIFGQDTREKAPPWRRNILRNQRGNRGDPA